jgi:phosphatidylserine decarboxylase
MTGLPLYVRALPRRSISRICGQLARLHPPRFLLRAAIRQYARIFEADLAEAAKPIEGYTSFLEFFARRLKEGARSWPDDPLVVAAPADGRVQAAGAIEQGRALQVKGRSYDVAELLGDGNLASALEGGSFLATYLAPGDYHRFHWPFDARVRRVDHRPGDLWPVHPGAAHSVRRLLLQNERMILSGTVASGGRFACVPVGALNVGSIRLAFHDARTNRLAPAVAWRDADLDVSVLRGEEMGWFEMGSAVVLLLAPEAGRLDVLAEGSRLKVGTTVGRLSG